MLKEWAIEFGFAVLQWCPIRSLRDCIAMPTMTAVDTDVLAPFEIWEVPFGDKTIKFNKPLMLTPSIMPHDEEEPGDEEYLDVICKELSIDVFADNRDELLEAVHSNIRMNWKHFVCEQDNQLSTTMQAVKRQFLTIAELVDG